MSAAEPVDMAEISRLLESAWLESHWELGEWTLRPLTLGSMILARQTGMSLVLNGGDIEGLSGERLKREMEMYVWMHAAPVTEVLQRVVRQEVPMLDLAAYVAQGGVDFSATEPAAELLVYIRRQWQLSEATKWTPIGGKASPSDHFQPHWIPTFVSMVSRAGGGWERDWIMWELPYCQALQMEHRATRDNGWKTRKPGAKTSGAEQHRKAMEAAKKQEEATKEQEAEW